MTARLDRNELLARLRAASPAVLPSMLLCDFANLQREIEHLEGAGVCGLHFDVMDGQFVPNLTYGMPLIEAARRGTDLIFDVHLMIENPANYIDQFYEAGADVITIHAEAVDDPRPVLEQIQQLGALAGLAVNPPTPLENIESSLPVCDLVLAMAVMPGFGGQQFDEIALTKIRSLRNRNDQDLLLEIDGGVNMQTIGSSAEAGTDLLVVGSAIFCTEDPTASIEQLHQLAATAVETASSP